MNESVLVDGKGVALQVTSFGFLTSNLVMLLCPSGWTVLPPAWCATTVRNSRQRDFEFEMIRFPRFLKRGLRAIQPSCLIFLFLIRRQFGARGLKAFQTHSQPRNNVVPKIINKNSKY